MAKGFFARFVGLLAKRKSYQNFRGLCKASTKHKNHQLLTTDYLDGGIDSLPNGLRDAILNAGGG